MTPADFIDKLAFFHRKSLGNTEGLLLYNLIYQDLQTRAAWHWLEETDQLTATDADPIDLPADFRQAWEVRVDGDLYIEVGYLDREKYPEGSNPRRYYLFGRKIGFPGYSDADASNNVDLSYVKLGANLTGVSASPLCPAVFDPFFTERGVGLVWQKEGNYGKASNHLAIAEQMLDRLIAENNKPVKGKVRRIPHIDELYPRNY